MRSSALSHLPLATQALIARCARHLQSNPTGNLSPQDRVALLRSLRTRFCRTYRGRPRSRLPSRLPTLQFADRVQVRIIKHAVDKVIPFWPMALEATDTAYGFGAEVAARHAAKERAYQHKRRTMRSEQISVYDVPRRLIPDHIMAMARQAWDRTVVDEDAFFTQVNEWWAIYPGAGGLLREVSIKWAAQEYLYSAVGRVRRMHSVPRDYVYREDTLDLWFSAIHDGPCGNAALAYADASDSRRELAIDPERLRAFWLWWVQTAIPQAWEEELLRQELA